jgi:isopentenyldiphosphate isomerase
MSIDLSAELFETYDEQGSPVGLVPRTQVHAEGLWHKSAHVFLFNPEGKLYVQRRSVNKDIYANRWDYSVGEHLQPGESYLNGALRGLEEELGVPAIPLVALARERRCTTTIPGKQVWDRELQQAFQGSWAGPVIPDPAEVACVCTLSLTKLAKWMSEDPDAFTPWFLWELRALGYLP